MIKCIVFDCDCTLVDSSGLTFLMKRGYEALYPEREKKEIDFFEKCHMNTFVQNMRYLNIEEKYWNDFFEIYCLQGEDLSAYQHPFEDMNQLLPVLKEKGYLLGVNTSREDHYWKRAKKQLKESFELFDFVVTSDQITHPKPNGESLKKCLALAGCRPEELLYIGDSIVDFACAEDAGVVFGLALWGTKERIGMNCRLKLRSCNELLDYLNNQR